MKAVLCAMYYTGPSAFGRRHSPHPVLLLLPCGMQRVARRLKSTRAGRCFYDSIGMIQFESENTPQIDERHMHSE
jgi:hypothetical protein